MSNPAVYSGMNVTTFTSLLTDVGSAIAPTSRSGRVFGTSRTGNELERLRADARAEGFAEGRALGLESGRQEGYQDGVRAGYDDSMRQTLEEQNARLETSTTELNHVAELIGQGVATWSVEAEALLTSKVTAIAREILCQELTLDRSSVVAIVQKAIAEVTLADQVRIRVNPFDSPFLHAAKADIMSAAPALKGIEIVEDASILGGCVIDTTGGQVDATVDGQLLRLADAMEEAA